MSAHSESKRRMTGLKGIVLNLIRQHRLPGLAVKMINPALRLPKISGSLHCHEYCSRIDAKV